MNILRRRKVFNYSDEDLLDVFTELGMSGILAKRMIEISQIIDKSNKKLKIFDLDDYSETMNQYNVFVYDTVKYPPKSNPPDTCNN